MGSLRDLRRRIKSIQSTQKITKAMKAVSAAKMRRAQESVMAARPFARRLRHVLGRVGSASAGMKHPLLVVREPQKVAYIIVTSDRGLCGGFNSNVIRAADQEIRQLPQAEVINIGRKGRDYCRNRGYTIAQQYVGVGEDEDMALAREVAKLVMDKYTAEEYDEVYLVFSQFVNVLVQKPVIQKVLPVKAPTAAKKEAETGPTADYIFEPDAENTMGQLLPMYIENALFQSLLETRAGEHSARMTAMENATKNADDMIASLTLTMNRARQAAITKEISEIVGGAAALE